MPQRRGTVAQPSAWGQILDEEQASSNLLNSKAGGGSIIEGSVLMTEDEQPMRHENVSLHI